VSSTLHLLDQHSLSDLFTAVYITVDDHLKAACLAGRLVLPCEPHQKGTYSELMTVALVGDLLGQPYPGVWFDLVKREYRALFPVLPHRTRFYRVMKNLERVWADFALCLPAGLLEADDLYAVDSKPVPICKGSRFKRPRAMVEAATGRGSMGWTHGFKLHAVVNTAGLVCRFAVVPANESDMSVARQLLEPDEAGRVLGDKGYQGCGVYAKPRANLKKLPIWTGLMDATRKRVETVFSSLARSQHLGLGQLNSYWAVRAAVCRKIAAHNLAYFLTH
jgi:transposase